MSRRKNQLFNLSFLDLVTGALGAVIFLFVITPKGGSSAPDVNQVVLYMDTTEMKIFGELHDSLSGKRVGDTLFTVLVDYQNWPKPEEKKQEPKIVVKEPTPTPTPPPITKTVEKTPKTEAKTESPKPQPTKETTVVETGPKKTTEYKGDAPSVPAMVSFELNWASKEDNVDFFVCREGSCVYGGQKRNKYIGEWDSGKSRNRLFNNDLRTNQEAVRQFDEIIPGEYMLYAQYKESKSDSKAIKVQGLIYTKDKNNQQRGESYVTYIPMSKNRVLLGKVILKADGTYTFTKR